ncbi:hypothetical protein [Shewanella algae]|uniref:hypothetical protein n=1 Tax=Shewanella algae TaxID=38313 RepID=UPI0034D47D9E
MLSEKKRCWLLIDFWGQKTYGPIKVETYKNHVVLQSFIIKRAIMKSKFILNKNSFLLFFCSLVVFFILFRNSVSVLLGSILANSGLAFLFLLSPSVLLLFTDTKSKMLFGVFIVYVFISAVIGSGDYSVTIVGFFNIVGPAVFFLSVYILSNDKMSIFSTVIKILIIVGFINSIGAYVQGFVSKDLFGLISNDIYGNAELMARGGVELRLISFITSPQSLSVSLVFSFILCMRAWPFKSNVIVKYLVGVTIFVAGVLTISKVFFVFLGVFFLLESIVERKYKTLFFILVLSSPIVFTDKFQRIIEVVYYLSDISKYSAYQHWMEGFRHMDSLLNLFFGKGVGSYSRGAQLLSGSDSVVSVESYFIQIFAELGLIGFGLLILIIIFSLFSYGYQNVKYSLMLICFCVVGLFSPAIYGFVVGIQFSFLLVSSFFINGKLNENSNI